MSRATFFLQHAQVLDLYGAGIPADFMGNPPEARFFKASEHGHPGYQQSYPQKFWISRKSSPNQALATETACSTEKRIARLPHIRGCAAP
jgi:hypothetical protein